MQLRGPSDRAALFCGRIDARLRRGIISFAMMERMCYNKSDF